MNIFLSPYLNNVCNNVKLIWEIFIWTLSAETYIQGLADKLRVIENMDFASCTHLQWSSTTIGNFG